MQSLLHEDSKASFCLQLAKDFLACSGNVMCRNDISLARPLEGLQSMRFGGEGPAAATWLVPCASGVGLGNSWGCEAMVESSSLMPAMGMASHVALCALNSASALLCEVLFCSCLRHSQRSWYVGNPIRRWW